MLTVITRLPPPSFVVYVKTIWGGPVKVAVSGGAPTGPCSAPGKSAGLVVVGVGVAAAGKIVLLYATQRSGFET